MLDTIISLGVRGVRLVGRFYAPSLGLSLAATTAACGATLTAVTVMASRSLTSCETPNTQSETLDAKNDRKSSRRGRSAFILVTTSAAGGCISGFYGLVIVWRHYPDMLDAFLHLLRHGLWKGCCWLVPFGGLVGLMAR